MNTKILILNGPPGSGKDAAASHLVYNSREFLAVHKEMKSKLYDLVMSIYSVSQKRFWEIYLDRSLKDTPLSDFNGKSIREAMIYVSEEVIKPRFGQDYFARCAAASIEPGKLNVFSDGGFQAEVDVLTKVVGEQNIMLVRLYRDGCNFSSDSRSYLERSDFKHSVDIINNSTLTRYLNDIHETASAFWFYE